MPYGSMFLDVYALNFKNCSNMENWILVDLKNDIILVLDFFGYFFIFFCFILMKFSQNLAGSMDRTKFWWLPWFVA